MRPSGFPFTRPVGAAVVVVAVAAGAIVFTGPAGAQAQDLTVTNEGKSIRPGANLTFDVRDDASISSDQVQIWIDRDGDGTYDRDERNTTLNTSDGLIVSGNVSAVDLSAGRYTLMAIENDTLTGGESPQTTDRFTVDDTPPEIEDASAYTETGGTQAYGAAGETVVEVLFTEPLSDGSGGTAPEQGDVRVTLRNGSILAGSLIDGGQGDATGDRRVALAFGTGLNPHDIDEVFVAPSADCTDAAGNEVGSHDRPVLSATATVAEDGSNTTAWVGEVVVMVADADDEPVELRGSRFGPIFNTSTGVASRLVSWDSGGWATDQRYDVVYDTRDEPAYLLGDVSLDLRDMNLSVAADNTSITTADDLRATVSATPPHRDVRTILRDDAGDTVETGTVTLNESGQARVNFGQRPAGAYSVAVEDRETGQMAATESIHVTASTSPTATSTPTRTPAGTTSPTDTRTDTAGTATATATPTPAPTVTPTPTTSPTPTPTATVTPTGPSQPGFGPAPTVLAVLAGALLVGRRVR